MGDVFRNITLLAAALLHKWLSLSGRPGQPSAWVQDRVVTLAEKEEERKEKGREKEEKEGKKEERKTIAGRRRGRERELIFSDFLCLHRRNRHESRNLLKEKILFNTPSPSPLTGRNDRGGEARRRNGSPHHLLVNPS